MIQPIGARIAVKPDRRPDATESGLLIPETARLTPPMSGVVIAVGDWPPTLRRIWARAVRDAIERVESVGDGDSVTRNATEALGDLLHEAPEPEHLVHVGQRVIFPMDAGHEIVLNEDTDEAVVILPEDSVLGIYEDTI